MTSKDHHEPYVSAESHSRPVQVRGRFQSLVEADAHHELTALAGPEATSTWAIENAAWTAFAVAVHFPRETLMTLRRPAATC